jgi:hypothetical protein
MKYLKRFNESTFERSFTITGKIESIFPNGQKTPDFHLSSFNKTLSGTPIKFDRSINKYSIPQDVEVTIIGTTKDGNNPSWNNPIYVSRIEDVIVNEGLVKKCNSFRLVSENQKFCHECGSKLELKSRFCDECGTKQDMLNRPKSDDEKSVLSKLDDDKIDLKEKVKMIISVYEKDLIQHNDFDKKVQDVLNDYVKKYGYDNDLYKTAQKLCKKSLLIGTIDTYKSKSQDPEYRKMLDSLMDEFHDKDVDDYDTSGAMMKALLLDAANHAVKKDKCKIWKDEFFRLANNLKKDDEGFSNGNTLMGQMLSLEMMIGIAHKYPKHKSEFDKIFKEFLKDNQPSDLLKKTYAKEAEIKKQISGGSKLKFDSSGKEIGK